jgi:hypothetical protein
MSMFILLSGTGSMSWTTCQGSAGECCLHPQGHSVYDKILSYIGSSGDFGNTRVPFKIEAICVSKMSLTQPTSTWSHNLKTRTTCLRLSFLKVLILFNEVIINYTNLTKVNKNLSAIILEDWIIFSALQTYSRYIFFRFRSSKLNAGSSSPYRLLTKQACLTSHAHWTRSRVLA